MQIIYEINARFLNKVREEFPGLSGNVISELSIIEESTPKKSKNG